MPKNILSPRRAADVLLALCIVLVPAAARAQSETDSTDLSPRKPRFALGLNVMQPAIYGLASSFFERSHFVPIPLEAHVSIDRHWGLAGTLAYANHKDGGYQVQEVGIGLGPRVTFVGNGLRGFYGTVKVGIAFRKGHDYFSQSYYRVGMTLQPELGYSLAWGPPGYFMAFGAGVQTEIPLTETSHPYWDWNGLGKMINYYLPVINVTVGFDV
jgi:hypothetical protein